MIPPFIPLPAITPHDRRVFLFHRRVLCDRLSLRICPPRHDRAAKSPVLPQWD